MSGSKGARKEAPFNETKEVIVCYYHLLAEDFNEAVALAKENPEFEYGTTARIEVRPIQTKEESTGFVYPKTAKQSLRSSNRDRQPTRLRPFGVAVRLIPGRWWPVPDRKTSQKYLKYFWL